MKKNILILFFLISGFLFAESINIKITTTEDKTFDYEVDDNTSIFTITKKILPEQETDGIYGIKKIEGFNQLKNLKIIRIKNIDIIDNYDFLKEIPNLRELYISTTIITDIKFIENLYSLELLDFEPFIYDEDLETLRNSTINLENLELLKAIIFSTTILTIDNYYEEFNCIPKFINVKNKPYLDLGNNGITSVNDNEIDILSQFSEVNLWPNPILSDLYEMEKLQDLNIVTK